MMASVKAGMLDSAIDPSAASVAIALSTVLKLPSTQLDVTTKYTLTSSNAAELIAAAVL